MMTWLRRRCALCGIRCLRWARLPVISCVGERSDGETEAVVMVCVLIDTTVPAHLPAVPLALLGAAATFCDAHGIEMPDLGRLIRSGETVH